MDSLLKRIGGTAIAVGVHLLVSSPASGIAVSPSSFALLSHVSTHLVETSDMSLSKLTGDRIIPEVKTSSSYEPPVEGGPQSSQGSGTR